MYSFSPPKAKRHKKPLWTSGDGVNIWNLGAKKNEEAINIGQRNDDFNIYMVDIDGNVTPRHMKYITDRN